MIKDEQQLKEIVEQIKSTLGIEQLDELEREYNKMYKELKEKEEAKKGVVTKEEWQDFLTLREEANNNDEPMFGNH
jgi:hypothetical protein